MILAGLVFIPYYWRNGIYTIPEYLGRRYNEYVRTINAIVAFGIAVLSGIFFTHTSHGKIINLICGGVLLLIGLIVIYNDQYRK